MRKIVNRRFGQELKALLAGRRMLQNDLADLLDVSSAYVSSITRGSKRVSSQRVRDISSALALSENESRTLHVAAALDLGFEIEGRDE